MTPQERALEITKLIRSARLGYAEAGLILATTEHDLTFARAVAEATVIDQAGGPKALGGNQADRDRELTLGLEVNEDYQKALKARNAAELGKAMAQANLEALQNELKVLLAFAREGGIEDRLA